MYPKLIAIAGPHNGQSFELSEEDFTIGRESTNRLRLSGNSISRRHCVIRREEGGYVIADLGSHNGTFVNDVPVLEHPLPHGARLRIGGSHFIFLAREDEGSPPPPGGVQLDDCSLTLESTLHLSVEDSLYLNPGKLQATQIPQADLTRTLNALVKISTILTSARKLDALAPALLESVLDVIPAERGALLLLDRPSDTFTSVYGVDRRSTVGARDRVSVSSSVVRKVMAERAGLLSNEVSEADGGAAAESITSSGTKSLLVVPLIFADEVIGALHLDSTEGGARRLDDTHLQLLTAVGAMAAGALRNAIHNEWLEGERARLEREMRIEHNMIGESPRMAEVFKFIAKVAPTDATVLILGESGTGKELVARALHQNSRRAGKPFVAINCAVLSEQLLESELFGHERGAFTGAIAQKKGQVEVAEGGTIFLDEVGELATQLQAKLLRVLQQREFIRVGGTKPVKADIRVISATNRDLGEAVRDGRFRKDIYFRLNVVSIKMPPLRERREDIPLLANHYAAEYSKRCNREIRGIARQARAHLERYDWPGNVRELKNAIERAVVLGGADFLMPEDFPESIVEAEKGPPLKASTLFEGVKEAKKRLILKAVEEARGNYTDAARLLDVYPTYLHRLMKNLGLKEGTRIKR